jgi:hypothetical protein
LDAVVIASFWLIALAAFAAGIRPTIYLFFCAAPFGSLAVVPTALTGGLTFTPLPIAALLLIVRALLMPGAGALLTANILRARPLALMGLFWCVAVVTTLLMPRLFAGVVLVVPVRVVEGSLAPLAPSVQNLSQLFYLTISIATVGAAFVLMRRMELRQTVLHAILFSAVVMVLTGIVDMYAPVLGLEAFLEAFRTATYNLLVDAEVLGARRVVGLMPEASAFGSVCVRYLSLLYFLRHSFLAGDSSRHALAPVMLALAAFTYLSTSSAAYVGLAILLALISLEWLYRAFWAREPHHRRKVAIDLGLAGTATLGAICLVLLSPALLDMVWTSLDAIVFSKTETDSFTERSLWTATSLRAAIDTFGLGTGVGGTRASNSFVALVSNVGVLGAALYIAFLVSCFLQKAPERDEQGRWMVRGFRWSLLPGIGVGFLIGTSPDFGVTAGFIYGSMLSIGSLRRAAPRAAVHRDAASLPAPQSAL